MNISVIIPTLNEATRIIELLTQLRGMPLIKEIFVVDGGSIDGTAEVVRKFEGVELLKSEPGRGRQMNHGALVATSPILWFIHADCRPSPHADAIIVKAIQQHKAIGGAFSYRFNNPHWFLRVSARLSNLKNRIFKLFYGDMGIFVKRRRDRCFTSGHDQRCAQIFGGRNFIQYIQKLVINFGLPDACITQSFGKMVSLREHKRQT